MSVSRSSSSRTSLRPWVQATAHALFPVIGPVLSRHISNFGALDVHLPTLPPLSPGERIFILSPHPDDEVLGAGGLTLRSRAAGIEVQIGFLSNGDGSRTTQISQVLRGKKEKTLPAIARFRQGEALEAAAKLSVNPENVVFFGFPDGGAKAIWNDGFSENNPYTSRFTGYNRVEYERAFATGTSYHREALTRMVADALEMFAPTLVLTTHPLDTHLDHIVSYRLCEAAIDLLPVAKRPRLMAFLIHCGIWPVPNGFHPDLPLMPPAHLLNGATQWYSLPLREAEIAAKLAALAAHRTQLDSTPRYLHAFVRRSELFGIIK